MKKAYKLSHYFRWIILFLVTHPYLCGKFQEQYDVRTSQTLIGSGF
jgi:hypothetical protein